MRRVGDEVSDPVTWLDVAELATHLEPVVGSLWRSRFGIEYRVHHVRGSGDGALISLRGTSKTANDRTRYRLETNLYFQSAYALVRG